MISITPFSYQTEVFFQSCFGGKSRSLMGKDTKTLESSIYDSSELLRRDNGRSFIYMQKSKGESIAPCGTPWLRLRGDDNVEPVCTTCDRSFR